MCGDDFFTEIGRRIVRRHEQLPCFWKRLRCLESREDGESCLSPHQGHSQVCSRGSPSQETYSPRYWYETIRLDPDSEKIYSAVRLVDAAAGSCVGVNYFNKLLFVSLTRVLCLRLNAASLRLRYCVGVYETNNNYFHLRRRRKLRQPNEHDLYMH